MDREILVPLICAQLAFYKMDLVARQIADKFQVKHQQPSNRLAEMLEGESEAIQHQPDDRFADDDQVKSNLLVDPANQKPCQPIELVTWFTTQHREAVRTAAFSPDGKYLATGSFDNSIKILDVARIKECYLERNDCKPVIKTIYDHTDTVNQLEFHPNGIVLTSCSDDGFIKFYDLIKPSAKKSFRYLQDQFAVKSISYHPSGDFLIAGTDHSSPRIYDVHNLLCYIPAASPQSHQSGINSIRYSPNGATFATASNDGDIKVWDAVTGRVTNTIAVAHGGSAVTSVRYSRNGKYLLSCGLEFVNPHILTSSSNGRLWDLGSGKKIITYYGCNSRLGRSTMCFSQTEDFIFGGDENSNALVMWDTRTGALLKRFNAHQNVIGYVACSTRDNAVISCSEDARARIWMI